MNTNNEEVITPVPQTETIIETVEAVKDLSVLEINVFDNVLGKSVGPGGK